MFYLIFIVMITLNGFFLNSNYVLYADDLKIYSTIEKIDEVWGLQEDIGRCYVWCRNNRLNLNIRKCENIQFSKSFIGSSYNCY